MQNFSLDLVEFFKMLFSVACLEYSLPNNPEEHSPYLLHDGNLKLPDVHSYFYTFLSILPLQLRVFKFYRLF